MLDHDFAHHNFAHHDFAHHDFAHHDFAHHDAAAAFGMLDSCDGATGVSMVLRGTVVNAEVAA